ncbi:uncharacterized protein LOC124848335, partial [Vigna umbellata]|uniref:uncharacterized protein LOC124848335 n=1 Tax=Vigna umbellata TaxID=87088 RepID=UPI001F5EE2BF
MAHVDEKQPESTVWYLDSGCSTHMTGRKDWFVKIQGVEHGKIRFADNSSLEAEGSGRVVLRGVDGREVVIEEVMYVPGLKTNLLSLGQLLQKKYMMKMEDNCLSIFNQNGKVVVQTQLSQNRTFKVVMEAVNHHCFTATKSEEEWLWHLRFGHLNFQDLSMLSQKKMVTGLPKVDIPGTVCKECVQCKQTRGSFQ